MKAKLGAIFLVSVLAIAGAGAAYALWFEDLYIYTDIYTGDVDVEWSAEGFYCDQDKPVSTGEMYIEGDDDNILSCWIYNAYPCVNYYFNFNVECTGSIPVHFTPMYFLGGTLDPAWTEWYEIFIDRIVPDDGDTIYFNPPVAIWNIQLHQGDIAYGHYMIHFNNDLPQGSHFTFDFMTTAYQYNEDDYWG